jgi:hypothetical protein
MVGDVTPRSIRAAICAAVEIGIAYAWTAPPPEAAVSMPTIVPAASYSGPPESPGWTPAFVSTSPLSCSALPPRESVAVIAWCRAVTVPAAAVSVPVPPASPTAVTASPTVAGEELSAAVVSPVALSSCRTATSAVGAVPTTVAV